MKIVGSKNQAPATKSLRAPVGLTLVLFGLLLGCGKSDRGISSGPYPCVSEVTVAGEGTCKPLVLTVDKNGQKVYVESDRVTSQTPTTPPSHEAAVYAELWKICKERHLAYEVWRGSHSGLYYADAWHGGGVKWSIDPASGPTEAAERLIRLLKGSPTFTPFTPFDTGIVRP